MLLHLLPCLVLLASTLLFCAASTCTEATSVIPKPVSTRPYLCAPGHHLFRLASGGLECRQCQPGSFTGKVIRTEYPQGHKINGYDVSLLNGNTNCELCVPGTYSNSYGLSCPDVKVGQEGYVISSQSSLGCTPVSFTSRVHTPSAGATKVTNCDPYTFPLRWVAEDTTASPVVDFIRIAQMTGFADPCIYCPDGFIFDESVRIQGRGLPCTACGPGTYKKTQGFCGPCEMCTFRAGSVLDTYTPPNGSSMPQPWPPNCVACPQGRFSPKGATYCHPCPPGTSTLKERCDGTAGACKFACMPGQRVVKTTDAVTKATLFSCTACKAGTASYGNNANETCDACNGNRYAPLTGATTCLTCPAGKVVSSNHKSCQGCPPGSYMKSAQLTQDNKCIPCRPGKYAAMSESTACTNCAPGSYMGLYGAARCVTASQGSYVPFDPANPDKPLLAEEMCKPGTFQPYNSVPTRFPTTCTKCAPGRYTTVSNSSRCIQAPINSYTTDFELPPGSPPQLALDGTHGSTNFSYCPMGTWTGPSSTSTSFKLDGKTYIIPMETRKGVHGIRPIGEWESRRRNGNPAAGQPNASSVYSSRRRGCNSCPVHWYNDRIQGDCRECEPVDIKFLFIRFTDVRFSNWMRTKCVSCWRTFWIPTGWIHKRPISLFSINLPWRYIFPDDENDGSQCTIDTNIIIFICVFILVIFSLLFIICYMPVIVFTFFDIIRTLAKSRKAIANVAKAGANTTLKTLKSVLYYISFVGAFVFYGVLFLNTWLSRAMTWSKLTLDALMRKHLPTHPRHKSTKKVADNEKSSTNFILGNVKKDISRHITLQERLLYMFSSAFLVDFVLQTVFVSATIWATVPIMSTSNGKDRIGNLWSITSIGVLSLQQLVCFLCTIIGWVGHKTRRKTDNIRHVFTLATFWWSVIVLISGPAGK